MVETVFSSMKRNYGEYAFANKFHNMAKEMMM